MSGLDFNQFPNSTGSFITDPLLSESSTNIFNKKAPLGAALNSEIFQANIKPNPIVGTPDNDNIRGNREKNIIFGLAGNDSLFGGRGDDSLAGGDGNDYLKGNLGDDILFGGAGADTLNGGKNNDIFVFNLTSGGTTLNQASVIEDFNRGTNKIGLTDGLSFNNLVILPTGNRNRDTLIKTSTGKFLAIIKNVKTAEITGDNFTTNVPLDWLNLPPVWNPIGTLTIKPGERVEIPLVATDPNNDKVTYKIKSDNKLPTGSLNGDGVLEINPSPDDIGNYNITLSATDGQLETSLTFTLKVIPDPVTTTRVSGVIQNTSKQPLAGVLIELGNLQTVTNALGSFTIETTGALPSDTLKVHGEMVGENLVYPFIAEKLPLLLGQPVYEGFNNVVGRPIYLPPLDVDNAQQVNPDADTTVTTTAIPGASVFVEQGSLKDQEGQPYTGELSITAVPNDLTPAALPKNLVPDLVVTIQPGEMVFTTPAPLTLPNLAGYAPQTEMDLWSINPTTGDFDNVGVGKVNSDGSVVETISGGIRNSSWHFFAPPAPPPDVNPPEDNCDECKAKKVFNSEVELDSGAIIETHNLVTYQSNGTTRGLTLTYDSLRADPSPIIHFDYTNVQADPSQRLVASLNFDVNGFDYQIPGYKGSNYGLTGGEHFWSIQTDAGNIDAALQADLSSLPSGQYPYELTSGLRRFTGTLFAGSSTTTTGELLSVNTINSPFGSGWGLAGLQSLVVNPNGNVLLIDGDGSELLFEAPENAGNPYTSPPGDFSTLERLGDGTFRRTLKDKTVYTFNTQNLLTFVKDSNGNETKYVYNNANRLTRIIDPVGLTTTFNYSGERVNRITYPDGRITKLNYDVEGNLITITDPDNSSRNWQYDNKHHMIAETDKRGNTEETVYDEFGRAKSATHSDGSVVKVNPVSVLGLYAPDETINPLSPPVTQNQVKTTSTYTDSNGNVTNTTLDAAGQTVTGIDAVGKLPTVNRNEDNLVTTSTTGVGNQINYTYDEKGNVTSTVENIGDNDENNDLTLGEVASFDVGVSPEIVLVADFNADGVPDLVTGNTDPSSSGVSILLGNGDGSFSEKIDYVVGAFPSAVATGDINSDGKIDLVVGNQGFGNFINQASVLLGNGDGTFSSGASYDLEGQRVVSSLLLEDLDSDGDKDLIATAYGDGYSSENPHISIRLNDGNGAFGALTTYSAGYEVSSATVGDFNSDGLKDLATTGGNNVSIRLGNSDGTFGNSTELGVGRLPTAIKNADVNSDGNLDLIVANKESNNISVLLGNGDGTFNPTINYAMGLGPTSVALGDLNKDSYVDVVTANSNQGNISVRLGESNGSFGNISVYTMSGSYSVALGDLNLDGRLDIVATDTYNSVTGTYNNQVKVRLNTTGTTQATRQYTYDPVFNQLTSMTDELGRKTIYQIDPNNGNRLSTTQVVGSVGGSDDVVTTYTYTPRGLVDTETNPLGQKTDYDYDSLGRLIKITYAIGTPDEAIQRFEYDDAGNQTASIDENGNRTEYQYDAMNRLVKVIEADPDGTGPASKPVTSYTYDAAGNMVSMTDPKNNTTQYKLDGMNRLIEITDAANGTTKNTYDSVGNLISVIDELGHETKYKYDSRNRLTQITDPEGNVTLYGYDLDNNRTSIIDPKSNLSLFIYDSRSRLIKKIDPKGNVTSYEYDLADNLIASTDRNGNRTEFKYDDLNRLIQEIDPNGGVFTNSYDEAGNRLTTTDELGHSTQYQYDNRDRPSTIIDPLNGVTRYSYDGVGNLLSVTDELNRTTTYGYDALYRNTSITNPIGHSTTYGYDAVGNLIKLTDANNHTTLYSYDNLNRPTQVINAQGKNISTTYDAASNITAVTDSKGAITKFKYDNNNQNTEIIDPLGHTTKTNYDAVGNVESVTDANNHTTNYSYDSINQQTGVTDALNNTTSSTYDPEGNLLSVTDPEINTTSYTYDKLNRPLTETNQLGQTSEYSYDMAGNLKKVTDKNGRDRVFIYDLDNRQVAEQWRDANNNPIHTINYTYDAADQLTAISDPDSSYNYTYDGAGRLIQGSNAGTHDVPDVVLNYSYDAVGNKLSVKDNINGQLKGTETFTYNALNLVTKITQSGIGVIDKRIDMTYDAANQMTGVTRYGNLSGTQMVAASTYTYDLAGRLTDLVHFKGGTTFADYNWVFDAAGRITKFSSTDGISNYSYDNLDQLKGANHTYIPDENYNYDSNGNRTNTGYDTGGNNQLLGDGQYNYEYDAEGNLTKLFEIATGVVTLYEWDYRNRLTLVATYDSSGNIIKSASYTYDVFDRRIGKDVDPDGIGPIEASVERFVYDGEHIALTFDGDGNLTHRYLHGPDVDQILADENSSGQVLWALTDNLGTVRDVIDSSGAIQNHIIYDSFGQVTGETNPTVDFRFGYTGRELDEETGLYYYRARYYDPNVGRFISEDPIGFKGGDANLYRYVENSPVNETDPTGLIGDFEFLSPLDVAGKAIVLLGSGIVYIGGQIVDNIGDLLKPSQPAKPEEPDQSKSQNIDGTQVDTGNCPPPPPPKCEPNPGKEVAEEISEEVLNDLIQEATNLHDILKSNDPVAGRKTTLAVGLVKNSTGTREVVVASSNGSYNEAISDYAEKKKYILIKTQGLGRPGWHAEGRLIQWAINNNKKVIAIGVSRQPCPSCWQDIESFDIQTGNEENKTWKRTVENRPQKPQNCN